MISMNISAKNHHLVKITNTHSKQVKARTFRPNISQIKSSQPAIPKRQKCFDEKRGGLEALFKRKASQGADKAGPSIKKPHLLNDDSSLVAENTPALPELRTKALQKIEVLDKKRVQESGGSYWKITQNALSLARITTLIGTKFAIGYLTGSKKKGKDMALDSLVEAFKNGNIVYKKLAQGLLGYIDDSKLQSKHFDALECSGSMNAQEMRTQLQETLRKKGLKIDQVFSRIDEKPLGIGTVAGVFHGVLKETGESVAIKVLKPGIRKDILETVPPVNNHLKIIYGYVKGQHPEMDAFSEYLNNLPRETDLELEATFLELYKKALDQLGITKVQTPRVFEKYSDRDVLVLEYAGKTSLAYLIKSEDIADAATALRTLYITVDAWGKVAKATGMIHSDLHFGNIFYHEGKIYLLDLGSCDIVKESAWKKFRDDDWAGSRAIELAKSGARTEESFEMAALSLLEFFEKPGNISLTMEEKQKVIVLMKNKFQQIRKQAESTTTDKKGFIELVSETAFEVTGAKLSAIAFLITKNTDSMKDAAERIKKRLNDHTKGMAEFAEQNCLTHQVKKILYMNV